MSEAHEYSGELNPPSPRIMRILSRTFALWVDTWYFDRKQVDIPNLKHFLIKKPEIVANLNKNT
jgi:hypothetical protein